MPMVFTTEAEQHHTRKQEGQSFMSFMLDIYKTSVTLDTINYKVRQDASKRMCGIYNCSLYFFSFPRYGNKELPNFPEP